MATLTDSQLGAIGNAILNAQYSKKQESQADDYGYEFLKACGKNPWGMAMLRPLPPTASQEKSHVPS